MLALLAVVLLGLALAIQLVAPGSGAIAWLVIAGCLLIVVTVERHSD